MTQLEKYIFINAIMSSFHVHKNQLMERMLDRPDEFLDNSELSQLTELELKFMHLMSTRTTPIPQLTLDNPKTFFFNFTAMAF